jgi:hypothetical protein
VYGLLAVCAALVLAARPEGDDGSDAVELSGRTSHRAQISVYLEEGRVARLHSRVWVWCPDSDEWWYWSWSPAKTAAGVELSQDGSRFVVRERESTIPRFASSTRFELRGRLAPDGRSARGTIDSFVRQRGQRPSCSARTTFRVTR